MDRKRSNKGLISSLLISILSIIDVVYAYSLVGNVFKYYHFIVSLIITILYVIIVVLCAIYQLVNRKNKIVDNTDSGTNLIYSLSMKDEKINVVLKSFALMKIIATITYYLMKWITIFFAEIHILSYEMIGSNFYNFIMKTGIYFPLGILNGCFDYIYKKYNIVVLISIVFIILWMFLVYLIFISNISTKIKNNISLIIINVIMISDIVTMLFQILYNLSIYNYINEIIINIIVILFDLGILIWTNVLFIRYLKKFR